MTEETAGNPRWILSTLMLKRTFGRATFAGYWTISALAAPLLLVDPERLGLRFRFLYVTRRRTLALGLWGIGGGAATVRFLDHYYFGQYSKAVLAGGMDEVCETGHFQQLIPMAELSDPCPFSICD